MAAETYRITEELRVEDKTGTGLSSAERKVSSFDSTIQTTQTKLDKLTGGRWSMTLNAVDKATGIISSVEGKISGVVKKAWNFTVGLVDKATAPLQGIFNMLKNPILQAGAVLGISVGLADTISTFGGFEATMSKVQAISGADEKDMERLISLAKEMGATTKFTAEEAAQGLTYMAMAGWKPYDMMGSLAGVMNLAAASGEDLATVSDIVTDAMTAFGLAADGCTSDGVSNATHFADVLAAASSNANTNVSLMGETFKYVGSMAGAMGYSIEDVALMTGLMANQGIKGTMAGTSLNSMLTRLSTNTSGAADAIADLGVQFYNQDGSARSLGVVMGELRKATAGMTQEQKSQLANTVAGMEAQKGFLAILNASEEDYMALAEAIYNADGAAQEMSDTMMDNMQGSMILLQSAVDGVKLSLGERLSPYVREFADWLTSKMPAVESVIGEVMDFIDGKVENLRTTIADFTSSEEWTNADVWGKLKIAWDEIVAEPFSEWWDATGKPWLEGKMTSFGETLGSGLTAGLLALLGWDTEGAIEDGKTIGSSFIDGFKEGFDTDAITTALSSWAEDHDGLVAAAGVLAGGKLLGGLARGIQTGKNLFSGLFGGRNTGSNPVGTATTNSMTVTANSMTTTTNSMSVTANSMSATVSTLTTSTSTMTATANTVIVNGGSVSGSGASGAANAAVRYLTGNGTAPGLPGGSSPLSLPGGSGSSSPLALPPASESSTGAAGAAGAAGASGVTGALAGVGASLGSGATTTAGLAAAGGAAIGGGALGAAGLIDAGINIYNGTQQEGKEAQDSYYTGGMQAAMVAEGAAAGAAVGSVVPVVGTAVGGLVGAGVGGIGALVGGDAVGQYMSDMDTYGMSIPWVLDFSADTSVRLTGISEQYADELDNIMPEIEGTTEEKLGTAIQSALESGEKVGSWDAEQMASWLGIDGMSDGLHTAISNLADDMAKSIPQALDPEMFTGAAEAILEVFKSRIEGSITAEDLVSGIQSALSSGADMSSWSAEEMASWFGLDSMPTGMQTAITNLAAGMATSLAGQDYTASGEAISTGVSTAIESADMGPIEQSINNVATNTGAAIDSQFATGFDTTTTVRVTADYVLTNPTATLTTSGGGTSTVTASLNAEGGYYDHPELGWIGEDGPEYIIPVGASRRDRGLSLWQQAGHELGMFDDETGETGTEYTTATPVATEPPVTSEEPESGPVQVSIDFKPEITIQTGNGVDEEEIARVLRERVRDMVDDIGDEMAERLTKVFSNMPVKGGA